MVVVVVEVGALPDLYIVALPAVMEARMVLGVEVPQVLRHLKVKLEKVLYALYGPETLGLTQAQTQETCNGLVYSNS